MIKLIHCADVHLDSAFSCGESRKSEIRRQELRATFSSLMRYIKNNGIDIALIAGDLFDTENVSKDTVSFLIHEFSANKECRFVISPGNHDPYTEKSVYSKALFPSNVYIFDTERISRLSFDDLNTDIYGYAFTSPVMTENPFVSYRPVSDSRINILCAHGDMLSENSDNCPIRVEDIRNSGFDYVALGHVHNPEQIAKAGNTYYAYSGCLEGRDFGECGYKGAIYGELEKDRCELKADLKRLRFSKRRYEVETLNVTGAANASDIAPMINQIINEKSYGDDTLLRVVLEGDVSPELVLTKNSFMSVTETLFHFEIKDKTRPLFDCAKLESDKTIRGAFYNELKEGLESEDEKERETASMALKYGLTALGGGNVIDF